MWGKIQLKPVHSWEPCGKDHSLWYRTAMQPKAPQGGCLVAEQPQAGLQWICWGSTWTNPKELLFWGYLGGRKEQPQAAAGALGLQGCTCRTPTMNSCQPLVPPDPAAPPASPSQVRAPQNHKSTQGAPCSLPLLGWASRWVQDFSGAPAEKPEGKLRIKLSP